jgi:hypothetical protein
MDLTRLSTAHKIAIGGALVLLIDSFLPWYSISFGGFGSVSINAWDAAFLAWGGVIAGVAAGVLLVLKASGKKDVGTGDMGAEKIAMFLGIASLVLILLRLLTEMTGATFGLFLGVIAAGAVAYGSYMASKEAVGPGSMTTPTSPTPPPPTL